MGFSDYVVEAKENFYAASTQGVSGTVCNEVSNGNTIREGSIQTISREPTGIASHIGANQNHVIGVESDEADGAVEVTVLNCTSRTTVGCAAVVNCEDPQGDVGPNRVHTTVWIDGKCYMQYLSGGWSTPRSVLLSAFSNKDVVIRLTATGADLESEVLVDGVQDAFLQYTNAGRPLQSNMYKGMNLRGNHTHGDVTSFDIRHTYVAPDINENNFQGIGRGILQGVGRGVR